MKLCSSDNHYTTAPHDNHYIRSDVTKGKAEKLIKIKAPFLISTFNVRTLDTKSKKHEIAYLADKYQLDVIYLEKCRISHSETLLQENLSRNTLVTNSCTKNSINASTGRIGFLLSKKVLKCCISIEKINDRIIKIDLEDNPRTSRVCCYSPTNVSSDQEVQSFYDALISTVSTIPVHNMLFIPGDFNAKIGPMEALYPFNYVTNRNGQQLTDFIDQYDFIATNTRFKKLWKTMDPHLL